MLHQKTTQNAVAAISRVAELYESGESASSADIAAARELPQPLVAKVLTTLARGRLITGAPGPGGGYRLARPPAEISLWDVVELFERPSETACPFGPNWCGVGDPCPLHQTLLAMKEIEENYLKTTTLAVFTQSRQAARTTKKKN